MSDLTPEKVRMLLPILDGALAHLDEWGIDDGTGCTEPAIEAPPDLARALLVVWKERANAWPEIAKFQHFRSSPCAGEDCESREALGVRYRRIAESPWFHDTYDGRSLDDGVVARVKAPRG